MPKYRLTKELLQDEQKRIESDEKASREELSDRADNLFWELDEGISRTDPLQNQPPSLETDEV